MRRKKFTKERTVDNLHMELDEVTVRGGKWITDCILYYTTILLVVVSFYIGY